MTKQAALGPIDPSVNNPLNPQAIISGQSKQVPVSVEGVRGYLDVAREELQIRGEQALASILMDLTAISTHWFLVKYLGHKHKSVLGQKIAAAPSRRSREN